MKHHSDFHFNLLMSQRADYNDFKATSESKSEISISKSLNGHVKILRKQFMCWPGSLNILQLFLYFQNGKTCENVKITLNFNRLQNKENLISLKLLRNGLT